MVADSSRGSRRFSGCARASSLIDDGVVKTQTGRIERDGWCGLRVFSTVHFSTGPAQVESQSPSPALMPKTTSVIGYFSHGVVT